mgnify:FL=1
MSALPLGDSLWLWWLGQPQQPRLVGELSMVRTLRGVSLRYAPGWLQSGFALSEDLPLADQTFLPLLPDTAAGAVDDARPDRWGERVIRWLDQPARLAVLDYLFHAGDDRFGALGVSRSPDQYQPHARAALPHLGDLDELHRLVQQVQAGEPVDDPVRRRLLAPGATMGGARPKGLIDIDGHPWVIKFNERGETLDWPLIEHATLTLAARAGIRVAPSRALPLQDGRHAVAVRRFDREPGGRRRHALSAQVALRAAGEVSGYPELAQLLRRRGIVADGVLRQQMRELFRRMVFNILIDNTDDHDRNHVLLTARSGELELSPAFDVLPAGQNLGYQQMRVGSQQADATLDNALSESAQFGLTPAEAGDELQTVVQVVAGWADHLRRSGVAARDLEVLATSIDRPFLREQRAAWQGC